MLTLELHGGHRQIGGNKILLRSQEGAVFLDFGKDFEREGRYFEEPWNRPFHIPSLLSIGALPAMSGLYRIDSAGPPISGVIVSHAHVDHGGYVPLLSASVPVYLGADTKNLIDIRLETGQENVFVQDDHIDWRPFRTGDLVPVGESDIRFRPIHVDHSVPAAYGFIIEAGGKRIAYTGDLRMHGRWASMTDDFLAALGEKPSDILICEGTNVFPPEGDPDEEFRRQMELVYRARMGEQAPQAVRIECRTEEEVERGLCQVIGAAQGLVLVEVSPLDLDRMYTVWRATQASGRTLVLPERQAYMMKEAALRTQIRDLVPVAETALLLSQRRKRKGERLPDEPEDVEEFKKWRYDWEKEAIEAWEAQGATIFWGLEGRAELRSNGRRYVVCAPQVAFILPELCYRAPSCRIDFVLSKSEPFTEEMVFSFDKLLNWLALYGCQRYYQIHVSGHAGPEDLRRLIEVANPGLVVPVHTKHPELFARWHDRVLYEFAVGEEVRL